MTSARPRLLRSALVLTSSLLVLTACGSDPDDTASGDALVVYVGRDEELVSPLIEQFTEETGIQVEARYAGTTEHAATLIDEGDRTPADVFLSQDAGALGALADEGLLRELPADITGAVLPEFTSTDGSWVGITGRARVIAYDGEELSADEVPGTVATFAEPEWSGRVGFPPGNASFQAFVTAYRVAEGDDAARAWLEGMESNDLQEYENNVATLTAVDDGALDIGLINHYYWFRAADEVGAENMRAQLKFADPGDPGALVNVTGAGVLSDDPDALAFVEYLISETGQAYFVENTFEYPLVPGVAAPEGLPPLQDLEGPDIDLSDLADLAATVTMIEGAGLL
ncbi:ABC transporter, solute-binding protein [Aeromicrobium marinum DSM 15272]|uniref:ABC transporter, solute-binding protein n=1 Tax=Aeromicrobium marinum DSM 15272 TaxID=585531 RepID=E2S9Q5_9ACTN|nr:iron ABC transporter substrate-binding protein [Aeromicrobium marinum]EFQ83979.1 ABC transporter, solute-binding protein [Aeromicrobium marinum DSM 15272]